MFSKSFSKDLDFLILNVHFLPKLIRFHPVVQSHIPESISVLKPSYSLTSTSESPFGASETIRAYPELQGQFHFFTEQLVCTETHSE